MPARVPALAPFRVRSYRFQWPADLSTSWAFEMETIILGWYILVETGSVLMLTAFASLQYIGTLLSPMFGVAGHRIGNRTLLCSMRAAYTALAAVLMTLAYTGALAPAHVFVIAALMGLMRPSDQVMRYALIGETIPPGELMGATSISRTTQDSARIAGALTGAGTVAALGMGPAYTIVMLLYATSFLLTRQVGAARPPRTSRKAADKSASRKPSPVAAPAQNAAGEPSAAGAAALARTSVWRDLKDGFAYVWAHPPLLAAIYLAFLVNVTAFPLVNALMPYVAREVYGTDQRGLGYLVAGFATGALLGSLVLSWYGRVMRPGRTMLVFCALWYVAILAFAWMGSPATGIPVLIACGFAQSFCMVPLAAILLRNSREELRSRVMGLRMLAVYGVPVGLLVSGPLISRYGFPLTATLYAVLGLAFTAAIGVYWRSHLWRSGAPANTR